MIKKIRTNEGIQYKKLSQEEMKARGILGRLIGPCADFNNATRNGRKYSEQLWENVFNDPIMQEKIKNGVCFGELGHPEDRTEIDMEKIAVCLREQPVKNEKGQLCAVFDILDTPNGRILKTLCDYGSTVGISSRGQGDLISDADGNEIVDPDTYECECWDIVLVPAVKTARLQYVKEGLDNNNSKMKKALRESLRKATAEEKKVMEDTLKELNINLNEAVNSDEAEQKDYEENAEAFLKEIETEMSPEEAKRYYYEEFQFDKSSPKDDIETRIEAALKAKMSPTESLKEEDEKEEKEVEEVEETSSEDKEEKSDEEADEEEPELDIDDLLSSAEEEIPLPADDAEVEAQAILDAESEEAEEAEEDMRSDAEVFCDYLIDNFSEEQIKEVCKVLDIELPKEEAEDEEAKEEEKDEEEEVEDKSDDKEEESNDESREDKEEDQSEDKQADEKEEEADDDGDESLVESLMKTIKSKSNLENEVKSLQEKLAVSDTKVNKLNEEISNYKKTIARLATISKSTKDLQKNVSSLEESLKEKDDLINEQKTRINRLVKSRKESVSESLSLNESIESKATEIKSLNESLKKAEAQVELLNKQLTEATNNSSKQVTELQESVKKAESLKESYKKLANKAVNKYIDVKANMLGLTNQDIKRKLGESYTLEDVDQVCEELKSYQLNVSKLPFSVDRNVRVRVNESTSRLNTRSNKVSQFDDDDVDDNLIKMANLDI